MNTIDSLDALEALYDEPVPASLTKVARWMTPNYRRWIEASRFLVISTVGPEGTDASPRGEDGPVVKVVDDHTIWLPDWRGNNRIDSLRNIVRDGRASLMFMVPGCDNVVRINGRAALTADEEIRAGFAKGDKLPKTVIVVTIGEMYFQCAKAIMRSQLWAPVTEKPGIPTAGQFVKEMKQDFDAKSYDEGYAEYAAGRMW